MCISVYVGTPLLWYHLLPDAAKLLYFLSSECICPVYKFVWVYVMCIGVCFSLIHLPPGAAKLRYFLPCVYADVMCVNALVI